MPTPCTAVSTRWGHQGVWGPRVGFKGMAQQAFLAGSCAAGGCCCHGQTHRIAPANM